MINGLPSIFAGEAVFASFHSDVRHIFVRRAVDAPLPQTKDDPIQPPPPEGSVPCRAPEPAHKPGTQGIVKADEGPAGETLFEDPVPEPPQRPHLGTVIGAVDAGRDIACVRMAVTPEESGIAGADLFAAFIVVGIAAEKAGVTVAGLVPVGVVVGIAPEKPGVAGTGLLSAGVIICISAEEIRLASSGFMALFVVVGVAAENVRIAVSLVRHNILTFPYGIILPAAAGVISRQLTIPETRPHPR